MTDFPLPIERPIDLAAHARHAWPRTRRLTPAAPLRCCDDGAAAADPRQPSTRHASRAAATAPADDRLAGGTRLALLPPLRPAARRQLTSAVEHDDAARGCAGRARLRDRPGPPHGRRHARRPPGSSATARRPSPRSRRTGPRTTAQVVQRRIDADRARPQHRPDRAARVQAPLEHAALGRPGTRRAARLAARPAGGAASVARQRRPPAAAHHRQPPGRRRARRRRLHADRRAVRRPRRTST